MHSLRGTALGGALAVAAAPTPYVEQSAEDDWGSRWPGGGEEPQEEKEEGQEDRGKEEEVAKSDPYPEVEQLLPDFTGTGVMPPVSPQALPTSDQPPQEEKEEEGQEDREKEVAQALHEMPPVSPQALPTSDQPPQELPWPRVGALAVVHGLKLRPELNGLTVEILGYVGREGQRWAVKLSDGVQVAIRAANLEMGMKLD